MQQQPDTRQEQEPSFTPREFAALPEWMQTALQMLAAGAPRKAIKVATGVPCWRFDGVTDDARELLDEVGIERLEQWRQWEADRASLDVLPGYARNCLIRNNYHSASQVCAASDEELLAARGLGKGALVVIRRHFPYQASP